MRLSLVLSLVLSLLWVGCGGEELSVEVTQGGSAVEAESLVIQIYSGGSGTCEDGDFEGERGYGNANVPDTWPSELPAGAYYVTVNAERAGECPSPCGERCVPTATECLRFRIPDTGSITVDLPPFSCTCRTDCERPDCISDSECSAPVGADTGVMFGRCTPESVCELVCEEGRDNCDGDDSNGCETFLLSSRDHCGGCNQACGSACLGGTCEAPCEEGRGNCDDDDSNGCEAIFATDPMNCGMCGMLCESGCVDGMCLTGGVEPPICEEGTLDCDLDVANGCEVDSLTDPLHCGDCNRPCESGTCEGGSCILVCEEGLADCDGDTTCETDLMTSTDSCGSCGEECVTPNGTPQCDAGECKVSTCEPQFADCDGDAATGCEVQPLFDPNNCGECGNVCDLPNVAAHGCASGTCVKLDADACEENYGDCIADGSTRGSLGCETFLLTDPLNCGRCGNNCGRDGVCSGGRCCDTTCPAP